MLFGYIFYLVRPCLTAQVPSQRRLLRKLSRLERGAGVRLQQRFGFVFHVLFHPRACGACRTNPMSKRNISILEQTFAHVCSGGCSLLMLQLLKFDSGSLALKTRSTFARHRTKPLSVDKAGLSQAFELESIYIYIDAVELSLGGCCLPGCRRKEDIHINFQYLLYVKRLLKFLPVL